MWYILDTYASCGVWTCSPHERAMYIITFMTIITYILNYIKCKNGKGDCNYLIYLLICLTLRIILKTFSTICLLEGDRGRSIWKVKTFFLMSTPYVMKSLPSEYVLVPKKIFPRLHKWVECGFWDSLLNMCSALKQGKTRQKNLNQQDFSKSKWKKLLIQFVVWHFSIKKVFFIILTLFMAFLRIVTPRELPNVALTWNMNFEKWSGKWVSHYLVPNYIHQ